jgi:phenylacetic acid degradation protein paaN
MAMRGLCIDYDMNIMTHALFERHRPLLEKAVTAIHDRTYWSAYPEVPSGKVYGETAKDDGEAAFKNRLNKPFYLDQPGGAMNGAEESPFGFPLGITYQRPDLNWLLEASTRAMAGWAKVEPEMRVGVCLEILHRLNKRSFEIAYAVMHTTGQGFMMAFQAGGPHAQDRGLEAVAYAWDEMSRVPRGEGAVTWQKQVSKTETITLSKTYRIVPRGLSLVIGCSTFPTWNSYPAIFASLATGNAVVIKPHPGAILPLAVTVEIAREVLKEQGFDPNVITLAADTHDDPITKALVARPEIRLIDYTGSSVFGEWIERQAAPHAMVFTEKAGVNSAIIDSVADLRAMTGNLAFTLSLYSGQMCTTTQNIYVPREGVMVGGQRHSFDQIAQAIVDAVNWLLGEPKRAAEILGAIQNDATLQRVDNAAKDPQLKVLRPSAPVANEAFPKARTRSPLILKVDATQKQKYMHEMFGPVCYIVATDDTWQSIDLARQSAKELGAITWSLYSTDSKVIDEVEDAAAEAGVPLSVNLTGQIYVNQSAAFSDYHVSGCNPSGNATLTDAAFVASRFRVVQSRMPAAASVTAEVKPAPAAAPV